MYIDGKYVGYIYKISNTVNNKLYIGQTVKTIQTRFREHIRSARTNTNQTMIIPKVIKKYGEDNFSISEIEKIIEDSKEELFNKLNEREIFYISLYNTVRPNGYNVTSGGHNSDNLCIPVDQYDLNGVLINSYKSITDAAQIISNNDIPISVPLIRYVCNGKYKTAKNYIFRFKGESFDKYETTVIRNNKKAIDQYDLNGNLLNTFESKAEAVKYLILEGHHLSEGTHISSCCLGKRVMAHGYIWRYHNDLFDKFDNQNDIEKYKQSIKNMTFKIDQYDFNGNLICTYENIKELYNKFGYTGKINTFQNGIIGCCQGNSKNAYGYVWRYHGDDFNKHQTKYDTPEKKVLQFTKSGEFVNTYNSVKEAAKAVNKTSGAISMCCHGKTKSCAKYIWKFENKSA